MIEPPPAPETRFDHDVFISYRRSDGGRAARWLRNALLRFRLPAEVRRGEPKKPAVYLDTIYERATDDFFERNIRPALERSRHLVVIATPDAMRARTDGRPNWVEREIEVFRATPQGNNVMVARARGNLLDPLPGDLARHFPNIEIVSLRDLSLLRFVVWPKWWRLRDELLKIVAPVFDVAVEDMPALRREERNRRLRLTWLVTFASALLIAVMAGLAAWAFREYRAAEASRRAEHAAQVRALLDAGPQAVPDIIKSLEPPQEDVLARLREVWREGGEDEGRARRLRAGLALLALSPPDAEAVKAPLYERMLQEEDPSEMLLVRDSLARYGAELAEATWRRVDDPASTPDGRFRALVALAAFDGSGGRWAAAGEQVAARLVETNPLHLGPLARALRPVRAALVAPLAEVFRTSPHPERRQVAASLLAEYAADQTETLVGLIKEADAEQYRKLFPLLQLEAHREKAAALLREELAKSPAPRQREPDAEKAAAGREALMKGHARAAVALLQLGDPGPAWALLRQNADPGTRTHLLHSLGPLGTDASLIVRRLRAEPDVSARRALILSLGEFDAAQLPPETRRELLPLLLGWYRSDPDPGIHGAVDWLLRHGRRGAAARKVDWRQGEALAKIDRELAGRPPQGRGWYVTKEGQTMTVVRGPVTFMMSGADDSEKPFRKRISRTFAVSSKEVSVAQFKKFLVESDKINTYPEAVLKTLKEFSPDDDGPVLVISWFAAVHYCNWLSKREGLPECYVQRFDGAINVADDYLESGCYRLPSEAEWEYAARAGTETDWYFGSTAAHLGEYAWYLSTSDNRVWPSGQLKPNDLGFFDFYGNAAEWVQDRLTSIYPDGQEGANPYQLMRRKLEEDVGDPLLAVSPMEGRLIRGGSFSDRASETKSGARNYMQAGRPMVNFGFRVARTLDPNKKS